ncbi:PREDICTED: fibrous sheath-interacting protein 2 [Myotis brandtii]|uniref:fibrous sheath-interacting protein 2 n=1 Tax=Myotis brandtii TaxID=109478 RepID=UPI0007042F86|nr:PREDICTED: fibrous sheath-interacting protein 2 [Myotis brandtii]
MEQYLSTHSKATSVATTRKNSSSLDNNPHQCGAGEHKAHFPGCGVTALLDLPLEVKLPVIPGSNNLYYTTKLNKKLFQPSYGFNLTDPYCRLLDNQYNSLHDPHLRAYHSREDIRRRLKKGGYITRNNEVICNLTEFNKYRQYLTSLKLDFERHYVKEQGMLAKQINKLQLNNQLRKLPDDAQFQNWLLWEENQSFKDQEPLEMPSYLDKISMKLDQCGCTREEQRLLWLEREKRRQQEQTRRKHILHRKFEEEWKKKEMLLLTKSAEGVQKEAGLEIQRRRNRGEGDKKKHTLLEKKMAYHLPKKQENGFKRKEMGKNLSDDKGQDGTQCKCKNIKNDVVL